MAMMSSGTTIGEWFMNLGILLSHCTVNVDIFACIHFCGIMKMGDFARIKIRVFSTNESLGYNDSNFHSVYIFKDI